MTNPVECAFCSIVRGEDASVEVVAEGASWIAFFPLEPATPGHTLVIPREHVPNLWDATADLAGDLAAATIAVGKAIDSALRPSGMNLISSAGTVAEQTVFHLHLHLVPRWPRDALGPIWPIDGATYEDATLADAADRIRSAFHGSR